jgi:predicted Rossmann-fold nucleotide-binding protein
MVPDPVNTHSDTIMLVCGGRNYTDKARLSATLNELLHARGIIRIIAGGAKGADTLAEEWAKACGVPCYVYMANWAKLGRNAGPIRNQQMLDEGKPNLVVAFPGGRGTADMVRRARAAGIEVIEVGAA